MNDHVTTRSHATYEYYTRILNDLKNSLLKSVNRNMNARSDNKEFFLQFDVAVTQKQNSVSRYSQLLTCTYEQQYVSHFTDETGHFFFEVMPLSSKISESAIVLTSQLAKDIVIICHNIYTHNSSRSFFLWDMTAINKSNRI